MSPRLECLIEQLGDAEYRRGFVEGHAKDTIAFQIRQLRKLEDWDQSKLAEIAFGNSDLQPMISRYENPDYGKYSIKTLLALAAAFDVALVVRFAPFSELLEWDLNSDEKTLRPDSYMRDVRLKNFSVQVCRGDNTAASSIGSITSFAVAQAQSSERLSNLGAVPSPRSRQALEAGVA